MNNSNTPSLTFCVDNEEVYGNTISVDINKDVTLKFKATNLKACKLIIECCRKGDPADVKEKAATTLIDIGKIDLDECVQRVKGVTNSFIVTNPDPTQETFNFEIGHFHIMDFPGFSNIKVLNGSTELELLHIEKVNKKPLIDSFVADRYFGVNGMKVTLSWHVTNADEKSCVLTSDHGVRQPGMALNDEWKVENISHAEKYTLTAIKKQEDRPDLITQKSFTLTAFGSSAINAHDNLFPANARVLNVFHHPARKQMYALVQKEGEDFALLFESQTDVLDKWEGVYSKTDTAEFRQVSFDIKIASRPGVIYEQKLWLFGGSTHDADMVDNTYGYYDFDDKKWHDKGVISRTGEVWIPRMGHACVIRDKRVWLIGGCNPDHEFALSDIWIFNGTDWEKYGKSLPNNDGRCMMAAYSRVVQGENEQIWIYGGYKDIPSGTVSNDLYYLNDLGDFTIIKIPALQSIMYKGVSLNASGSYIYLFVDKVYKIYDPEGQGQWTATEVTNISNDWLFPSSGHGLQTVNFLNAIWINAVHFFEREKKWNKLGIIYYGYFPLKNTQTP